MEGHAADCIQDGYMLDGFYIVAVAGVVGGLPFVHWMANRFRKMYVYPTERWRASRIEVSVTSRVAVGEDEGKASGVSRGIAGPGPHDGGTRKHVGEENGIHVGVGVGGGEGQGGGGGG